MREELARVLANAASVDEFVHGLMGFLVELSRTQPTHPLLAALGEELGRASVAPFAALAMHDLRSIMQGVNMSLEMTPALLERSGLLAAGRGRADPQQLDLLFEAIEDAQSGARLAAELARETLAVNREEPLPQQPTSRAAAAERGPATRLNSLIELAARLGRRLVPIELHLETPDGLEIRAERSAVFRVLVNLLRNAAHAIAELEQPENCKVTISTWASDEFAFIQVADEGPGIPPGARDQIFDLFFTTHAEGTGIGLYVCRTIVTGWGGRIHVDSHDGEGARFTFSVPRRP